MGLGFGGSLGGRVRSVWFCGYGFRGYNLRWYPMTWEEEEEELSWFFFFFFRIKVFLQSKFVCGLFFRIKVCLWLVVGADVNINRVLNSQFPGRRHVEKMPHQT